MPNRNNLYLEFTLAHIPYTPNAKNSNILDIGGSRGHQAHALSSALKLRGAKVMTTILDFDSPALFEGKKLYPELNYVRGDAHYLPFRAGIFDLVYSFSLLEHLKKPWFVLKEQVRVSKKCVIMQIPNLKYFVELHTKCPFLWMFPEAVRNKIVEITNPGMLINFDVKYKALVENFQQNGFKPSNTILIYHHNLTKLLLIPQGHLTMFRKAVS